MITAITIVRSPLSVENWTIRSIADSSLAVHEDAAVTAITCNEFAADIRIIRSYAFVKKLLETLLVKCL